MMTLTKRFKYKEYHCFIMQSDVLEHLCGYIQVPSSHPIFSNESLFDDLNVHGGITYHEDHLPCTSIGSGNFMYIGFDCAHAWDLIPGLEKFSDIANRELKRLAEHQGVKLSSVTSITLKDEGFVKDELKKLVKQLIALENNEGN
jgi:hypothetical protein